MTTRTTATATMVMVFAIHIDRANARGVPKGRVTDYGRAGHGDEAEKWVDDHEDDGDGDDGDGVRDPYRCRLHQRLDLEEVARDPREQLPPVHPVVISDVETEEAGEETPPQLRLNSARGNAVVVPPQT